VSAADDLAGIRCLLDSHSAQPGDTTTLLQRVCHATAGMLSASGAGISVMTGDGTRGICAASDPVSRQVEELQFVLGEGPCVDAFASRRPVLTGDLGGQGTGRWPLYAPAARASGVRAVFAFPMCIGAARLGVMDIYRVGEGPLSRLEVDSVLEVTDLTMRALLNHDPDPDIGHRAELFWAQGMVMVQMGVSLPEAMTLMRAYAYAENRRLEDVARAVVNRTLRFDRDRP
jgi:hypothetical protein